MQGNQTEMQQSQSTSTRSKLEELSTADDPAESPKLLTVMRMQHRLLAALLVLAIVYTLAMAKIFLIPLMLAFLLSLLLAPLVRWLSKFRLPRSVSAAVVVFFLLFGLVSVVSSSLEPIGMWVESAPQTLRNIEHKVYPLKQTVKEMTHAADQVDQMTTVTTTDAVAIKSVSFRDVLYENARSLVTGIIMTSLSLYFALSWGPVLVVRVKQLLRDPEKRKGFTELSMVLEQEVSSYLFTIAIINCGLGAAVAAVLYLFDVPHPVILGVVAMVLNFIPYLGALATFLVITATTLLSFDSLEMPALVGTVFLILTIAEGQIITPLILGRRLALNPLMVFVSIAFWFWLWGVMGALMAVPILIILKLVGDRVDIMRPIAALLAR